MTSLIKEATGSMESGDLEVGTFSEVGAIEPADPSHCSFCPPLESASAYSQGDGPNQESQSDVPPWSLWRILLYAIWNTALIAAIVASALHFGVRSEEFDHIMAVVVLIIFGSLYLCVVSPMASVRLTP
jgi:hypothetical protein